VSDPRHPGLRAEGAEPVEPEVAAGAGRWSPQKRRAASPSPTKSRPSTAFAGGAHRRPEPVTEAAHLGPGHYDSPPALRPAAARPSSAFASSPTRRMLTNRASDRHVRAEQPGTFSPPKRRAAPGARSGGARARTGAAAPAAWRWAGLVSTPHADALLRGAPR